MLARGAPAAQTTSTGSGQAYPAKPVRIIVPNAPSGLADVSARIVAAKLSESFGQQFVVENRVGAGSTLGTAAAVRAAADGYTLLAVFDSHATNPHLFRNLEYNTVSDLAPVSLLALPEVKSRFAELGLETVGSTPAQFDQWIKTEIERWGRVIRAQKIALE